MAMRVLMLAWEYPPYIVGGLGKHVYDIIPVLAAEGIDIYVITPQLKGGPIHERLPSGAHIIRVPVPAQEDTDFISFAMLANREIELAAQSLQRQIGPFDLVHTHDWLGAHVGIGLKRTWQVPLITTIHATERGRGRGTLVNMQAENINSLEWRLTYEAWRVIVCSRFMAQQVHEYFRTPFDKIDAVPNGIYITPDPFATVAERLVFRRHYVADDQPLVYFVGRMVYEKGAHVLLAAWPEVCAANPKAHLVLAGIGANLEQLKAQAAALHVEGSVTFTGFINDDDRDRLYRVADVAVFPSIYEAFGIVALEAMAARCPVVVSDTGGLAEVVTPHETGITVIPDHPGSLAWGINHTLKYPIWAATRADNAFAVARDRYNWQQIAHQTAAVYQRVYREWLQVSWGKFS